MVLELEVVKTPSRSLGRLTVADNITVKDLKKEIAARFKLGTERQSIRNGPKGKNENDVAAVAKLNLSQPGKIYVKDLGPQIGYDTVFFVEYAGPLVLYGLLYLLPQCVYFSHKWTGQPKQQTPFPFDVFPFYQLNKLCGGHPSLIKVSDTAYYALILWSIHYGKRLLETAFVHRFSHGTMPIFNLFRNSSYYWGFAIYIAYHVNHPLYTPPPALLFYLGVIIFIVCELGNLSIHLLLRDLRPPGSKVRKVPLPNSNPLTLLYNYVSCPNYTYEVGSWIGFTLLTGCLPVFIFALAGLYQMAVWAIANHKKYKTDFPNYPKQRKAILPFVL